MENTTSSKIEYIVSCGKVHFTEIMLNKPGIYKNLDKYVFWHGQKVKFNGVEYFRCFMDNIVKDFTRYQIDEMTVSNISSYFHEDDVQMHDFLKSL